MVVIVLFHVVGLIGFFTPVLLPLFLKIVPFHILLMLAVISYSHKWFDVKFLAFIAATFTIGFVAEWVGVHTHIIFGHYTYGDTLGLKLWDIPLMIGVNWFLLVYAAGVLMQYSRLNSAVARIMLGTVLLVVLDVIIEPVAIHFDYWNWRPHAGPLAAPVSNYAGWFGVGILMLSLFEVFKFKKQNMVAVVLLATQLLFFSALHLAI